MDLPRYLYSKYIKVYYMIAITFFIGFSRSSMNPMVLRTQPWYSYELSLL